MPTFIETKQVSNYDPAFVIDAGAGEFLRFHVEARSTTGGRGVFSFGRRRPPFIHLTGLPVTPPQNKQVVDWNPPSGETGSRLYNVQVACSIPDIEFDIQVEHHATAGVVTVLKLKCSTDQVSGLSNILHIGFSITVM